MEQQNHMFANVASNYFLLIGIVQCFGLFLLGPEKACKHKEKGKQVPGHDKCTQNIPFLSKTRLATHLSFHHTNTLW